MPDEFKMTDKDMILTNKHLYKPFVEPLNLPAHIMIKDDYCKAEPTDEAMDAMNAVMKDWNIERIFAFGGGSVIDLAKVLTLDIPNKAVDLFTGKTAPKKMRKLGIIPATCGTGSEVTNVAVAELKSLNIKKGLAVDETYAEYAVLITEPLNYLPDKAFALPRGDLIPRGGLGFGLPVTLGVLH